MKKVKKESPVLRTVEFENVELVACHTQLTYYVDVRPIVTDILNMDWDIVAEDILNVKRFADRTYLFERPDKLCLDLMAVNEWLEALSQIIRSKKRKAKIDQLKTTLVAEVFYQITVPMDYREARIEKSREYNDLLRATDQYLEMKEAEMLARVRLSEAHKDINHYMDEGKRYKQTISEHIEANKPVKVYVENFNQGCSVDSDDGCNKGSGE